MDKSTWLLTLISESCQSKICIQYKQTFAFTVNQKIWMDRWADKKRTNPYRLTDRLTGADTQVGDGWTIVVVKNRDYQVGIIDFISQRSKLYLNYYWCVLIAIVSDKVSKAIKLTNRAYASLALATTPLSFFPLLSDH